MNDQLTIDFKISTAFPFATPGQTYSVNGVPYVYKGTDKIHDMLDDLKRSHPELVDVANVAAMMANPLGFKPPTFQIDPKLMNTLTTINTAAKVAGAVNNLTGGALGAAAGGALSSLSGLAKGFVPPGLDGPIQAMKGAIGNVTAGIPGLPGGVGAAAAGAHAIAGQIASVKAHLTAQVKGPTAALFKAVNGNLLSDIPGADALKKVVNLQSQVAALAGMANNPLAFAAHAAKISAQFPMINVNAIANKLVSGALSGAAMNLNTMIPNMNLAGGAMKMLPIPGKTPVGNAIKPQKTTNPAKPVKALQMKNLFAEAAAGGALATLNQPLSAFMGMMSTIAPQTNLISAGPAKTSYGDQKLNGIANTVNWGSGGYGRSEALAAQEKKRLELSAKIEKHMAELEQMTDYSKLTSMSYADLKKKYPEITSKTSVAEALHIIDLAEKKAKNDIPSRLYN